MPLRIGSPLTGYRWFQGCDGLTVRLDDNGHLYLRRRLPGGVWTGWVQLEARDAEMKRDAGE